MSPSSIIYCLFPEALRLANLYNGAGRSSINLSGSLCPCPSLEASLNPFPKSHHGSPAVESLPCLPGPPSYQGRRNVTPRINTHQTFSQWFRGCGMSCSQSNHSAINNSRIVHSVICLFTNSFVRQMFSECLLCAKNCSRCQGYHRDKTPWPHAAYIITERKQ